MAAPQTITGLTLLKSGNLSYATLVVQDPNGNMAAGTTEFLQNPNGILIPKRADALGTPLTTSRITSALTTTALAASATYTQGWQDAQSLAVTYAAGSVTADQAGTLIINFSDDGTTIAKTTTLLDFVPNAAGTANAQVIPYPVQIPTRYFQFAYTNGSTAQGSFALYQTPMNDWSPRDVGLTGSLVTLDSTTTALAANGTYTTPTAFATGGYRSIVGSAYSDQSGTLLVEQSQDGTNWDVQSTVTVTGGSPSAGFEITIVSTYGRLAYTNGATAQTVFRLYARGKTL